MVCLETKFKDLGSSFDWCYQPAQVFGLEQIGLDIEPFFVTSLTTSQPDAHSRTRDPRSRSCQIGIQISLEDAQATILQALSSFENSNSSAIAESDASSQTREFQSRYRPIAVMSCTRLICKLGSSSFARG